MTGIEPAAFRLGGEPSILLRYMDVYKIFSVGRLLQQALRRTLLYPFNYGKLFSFIQHITNKEDINRRLLHYTLIILYCQSHFRN